MKKVIIIGLVFAGFGLASCSKQQIAPVSHGVDNIPSWEKDLRGDDDNAKPQTDDDDEITDPNNDPDGNKKN